MRVLSPEERREAAIQSLITFSAPLYTRAWKQLAFPLICARSR
jgi:hypothetical protein